MTNVPIYYVVGHSTEFSTVQKWNATGTRTVRSLPTADEKIQLGNKQVLVYTADCGMPAYHDNKKIFNLFSPSGRETIRQILSNPQTAKQQLNAYTKPGEHTQYSIFYRNSSTIKPIHTLNMEREKTDTVYPINNNSNKKFSNFKRHLLAKTKIPALKSHFQKVHSNVEKGKEVAKKYNAIKRLGNVDIKDIIGDKPGIFFITSCRGLGGIYERQHGNKQPWKKYISHAFTRTKRNPKGNLVEATLERRNQSYGENNSVIVGNQRQVVVNPQTRSFAIQGGSAGSVTKQYFNNLRSLENNAQSAQSILSIVKESPSMMNKIRNLARRHKSTLVAYGIPITVATVIAAKQSGLI